MKSLSRSRLVIGAALLAVWVNCASADVATYEFAGMRVLDAITDFENEGYDFLYSSSLVHRSLRFTTNPPAGGPMQRFAEALHAVGLTLDKRDGIHRIVRYSEARQGRTIRGRVVDAATLSGIVEQLVKQDTFTASRNRVANSDRVAIADALEVTDFRLVESNAEHELVVDFSD